MVKKLIALSDDGRMVLKLPGGKVEPYPQPNRAVAFLLVDCSSSMEGNKMRQAKEGAFGFAESAIKKHYSVGLISFADSAEPLAEPQNEPAAFEECLRGLQASGGTNMTDAIEMASRKLQLQEGTRAIVIVTDGMPNSKETCLSAAARAKSAGIEIITIGTDGADVDFLQRLSTRSDLAVAVAAHELKGGITHAATLLPSRAGHR